MIEHPWQGFATQRNVALDAARGDWALEVDADERITPKLRDEILALVADPPPDVDNAVMPLRQLFLGRPLGPVRHVPRGALRGCSAERATGTTTGERCMKASGRRVGAPT